MQVSGCSLGSSLVLIVTTGFADAQQKSDAELDGFSGGIKSVTTTVTMSPVQWPDQNSQGWVVPVGCRDCAYDADGTKTLSGQTNDGTFAGQSIVVSRDGDGHVTDKFIFDAATEQLTEHDVLGQFGKTEATFYQNGKPCEQQKLRYDGSGHEIELLMLDCDGKQQSLTETRSNKDGQWTERTYWRRENELTAHETYDPATDEQHCTSFDEAGVVNLTWTYRQGEVISFWEIDDGRGKFGNFFFNKKDNGDTDNYQCRADHCNRSRVHYEYVDAGKRHVKSAEWKDADGHTTSSAYYEYEMDTAGNWTSRRVWVSSSGPGERTLFETDARTIDYWNK